VRVEPRPFSPSEDPIETLRETIRSGGAPVSADLAWWQYHEVRGLGLAMADCSQVLRDMRVVKSVWEQDRLRECGRITCATMDRLEELLRSGATRRVVAGALYEHAIALGSGPFTAIPYVSVGAATFENHTTWDWAGRDGGQARSLAQSPPAAAYLLEFATNVDGYGAPLSRSASDHPAAGAALKAIEAGIEGVKGSLRPGADPARLHYIMQSSIEEAGFHFSHRAGYSVGLGEPETWMEGNLALLGPLTRYRIREGMVFHVVGSVVQPGAFGVARSNCVLVTASGHEVLTS
jgi:Xaa-Pro aminopeptidase